MTVSGGTHPVPSALRLLVMPAVFLAMLICPSAADETREPPSPTQGNVDASGKFVPAGIVEGAPDAPANEQELREAAAKLIEKTGEHTFRVGLVRCDRAGRVLTIPAKVNLRAGVIEYALVSAKGKVHEALFSTEADPLHVQMAALLIGIAPEQGKSRDVLIEVEWAANGPRRKVALEDLVALARETPQGKSGATLARGEWQFTGSQVDSKGFAASREGSLISLIQDPAALIVNPRPGSGDDSLHVPNAACLPVADVPVSVVIRAKSSVSPSVVPAAKP